MQWNKNEMQKSQKYFVSLNLMLIEMVQKRSGFYKG